ncbi:hypothetical protein CH371_20340, partial [Leptospira wolffii]
VLTKTQDPDTGVYLVTLDPALKGNYVKTTEVYTLSGIGSPDVRLAVDNNFYTTWNTQYQNAFSSTAWTTPQFLPTFVTTSTVPCSGTSLYNPLSCLGNLVDSNAYNWLGGYNQGVAHWNSWVDGGNFPGFLSAGLLKLQTSSGLSYRLESSLADINISNLTVSSTVNSKPINLAYNNLSTSIWRRDNTLFMKICDITAGCSPVGSAPTAVNT